MFPKRQEAVKVLYKAAGHLLDCASYKTDFAGRYLCQTYADNCVKLAEQIASIGPVKIICDTPTSLEVEGIPFDVGFVVETQELKP